MRHGNYLSLFYGEWAIIFFIGGVLAMLVGTIWLIHRRTKASDGLTPAERKRLPSQELEILSLLRQNGGPVRQSDLFEELPGDLEELAGIVKALETKGLLQRKWESAQGTYMVSVCISNNI